MKDSGTFQITAPGEREIVMTRVFDAPRRLVFDALTQPALIQRWLLGPDGWTMPVCEVDLRVGGAYRCVWRRDADGTEMGMGGVYREVVPNRRLVFTWNLQDGTAETESVVTVILTPVAGGTELDFTLDPVFDPRAADGWRGAFKRLGEFFQGEKP